MKSRSFDYFKIIFIYLFNVKESWLLFCGCGLGEHNCIQTDANLSLELIAKTSLIDGINKETSTLKCCLKATN